MNLTNFLNTNKNKDNKDEIISFFHVHIPFNTGSYKPSVVGSCEALGHWKPKVWLRQFQDSTLWVSGPVKIPHLHVEYRYCLASPENLNKLSTEECYAIVDYIYKSIESSHKPYAGIIDYIRVLKKNRTEESNKIIGFINQRLFESKTKEQMLFLCYFLGYYMEYQYKIRCLPDNFPSSIMIKEFKDFDCCHNLVSNAKPMVVNAVKILVQHNSKCGFLDWIIIFALAPIFDTSYSFVDSIEIYDYKEKPDYFIKLLKEIKPSIDDLQNFDSSVLNKVMNKLVMISNDAECLAHLQEHFKYLEDNDNFKREIRKKLLELLLKEPNLGWQHSEYVDILKTIADSNQKIVLESFPEVCKFISGLNLEKIKNELEKASIKWFINICKERSTYDIFQYLSMMHSTSTHSREILSKLLNHRITASLSDDSIFSITSRIDDFHEDIIAHFLSLVKDRVGPLVQDPDEHLFEKIMRICNSTESLNTEIETLYFILDRLQQIKEIKFSDEESFQLSLFQSAKFWMAIFKAKGYTQKLRSHPYFKETCKVVINLAMSIRNHTITIRLLRKIFKCFNNNDIALKDYINSVIDNYQEEYDTITEEVIEGKYNQCYEYDSTLERLQKFYEKFCPSQLVQNVKQYIDDLTKRSIYTTLGESHIKNHWSMHSKTIKIMKNYYHFVKSQTFYNVFQILLEAKLTVRQVMNKTILKTELTVKKVMNKIIKKAIENYKAICKEYDNWEEIKCSVANNFWKYIDAEHVEKEISFMAPYFNKLKSINTSLKLGRLHQFVKMIRTLDIIPRDHNFWAEELKNNLEDKELLLYQLCEIFDQLNEFEKMLTNEIWATITEISSAIDFVVYLKSLVGHDLKHLINGVDDHSDERLIKENTVQKFIQLKQILEPLLEKRYTVVQEFLQILREIMNMNPSLNSMLRLCNANAQALKNIYRNIANRGEMTKEKIFYSVTKGVYSFERMKDYENKYTAKLSYSSNISQSDVSSYTFADLRDLRSHYESAKTDEITSAHMNEFVIMVDLAQEIIEAASSLKELGHFKYRNFKENTHSISNMKTLLEELLKDLQSWKKIVNEAQQNHYYLTFFLAQHILSFYDYFSHKEENVDAQYNIKEKCSLLLKFVNEKAKLSDITSDIFMIPIEPKNYYDILCKIGTVLYEIFSQIPTMQRQIADIVKYDIVEVVYQERLFIEQCSTTVEELLTFVKRCFFATKSGYGEHLFCIANVELLNFELQYQLALSIRSLCQKEEQFYLALVCCLKNNMQHHILDQFSECIHPIQGFDANSMHNIFKKLCPNVLTVSSDLSGQGKTKWIEEQSFTHGLTPRKFLISDGMTFGMLIHQLSEFRLKNTESLHLNIMQIDHHYDVNMFLFELLSFKIVKDRTEFLSIPSTLIYIEIESTMNRDLLNSIPIIEYLERKTFDMEYQQPDHSARCGQPYLNFPKTCCRQLLQKYFFDKISQDIKTYRFLEIFVNVLADQLKRMSSSEYFRVNTLEWMATKNPVTFYEKLTEYLGYPLPVVNTALKNIRKTLLETLIGVSMNIATRSVDSKKNQFKNLLNDRNEDISIKPWEDSNHLLVIFLSQSPGSICALYRDKNKVPKNVNLLLGSQNSTYELDDYDNMSSKDILKKLEDFARTTHEQREYAPDTYVLSTDNLLKMALILLRSRANIPVVICGEAGCGKTSLIQFLSIVVNVKFLILNLHTGVTKQQILDFLYNAEMIAEKSEVWVFFDEINTCEHIGIFADLIAHRLLLGCHTQAGLQADNYEERSQLVYQVRPLPDQILDYVWDYGVLKPSDEKIYINMLVKKSQEILPKAHLFTELLFALNERQKEKSEEQNGIKSKDLQMEQNIIKSYILALSLCYQ
ncbi:18331_t:CDS:10, partial [Dentiscutata erythropus]